MTAEIAILNKSAVALAADSAVTIRLNSTPKVYQTANKIFELSENCPIAVMVYNRMDFMGIPFEVIIKQFRTDRSSITYNTVEECQIDFLRYLRNEVPYSQRDATSNTKILLRDAVKKISRKFSDLINDEIFKTGKLLKRKLNQKLQRFINQEVKSLEYIPDVEGMERTVLSSKYKQILLEVAEPEFPFMKLSIESHDTLRFFVNIVMRKTNLSSLRTGLVFTGFGEKELCPTLVHIEQDGIYENNLKYVVRDFIDITRGGPDADVLGFAQDDVVQSFVNGCHPSLRKYINTILKESIENSFREVTEAFVDKNKPDRHKSIEGVLKMLENTIENQILNADSKIDSFINTYFTEDVKSMVRGMPKPDLANLAEALIEITTLKRKVTTESETVGGEVDVAVLSKAEGLVWVKRKHYFPAELNPAYFARKYKDRHHEEVIDD